MKNFKFTGFAILALFLLAGVKCATEPPHYIYPLRDDTRPFFEFGEGSWWKYVNDSTGQIDSVYLLNSTTTWNYFESHDENYTGQSEILELTLISQVHIAWMETEVKASSGGDYGGFAAGVPYGSSYVTPNPLGYISSNAQFYGYFPTVTLGGQLFTDVYEFYNPRGNYLNDSSAPSFFFYKKDVGLIHWRLEGTDTSWTVTDYHIFS
jgi:hypothetical protein